MPDPVASAGAVSAAAAAAPVPLLAPDHVPLGPIPAAAVMPQQQEPNHLETLDLTDEEIDEMIQVELGKHLAVMKDLGIDTTVRGTVAERKKKLKEALKRYRSLHQNP